MAGNSNSGEPDTGPQGSVQDPSNASPPATEGLPGIAPPPGSGDRQQGPAAEPGQDQQQRQPNRVDWRDRRIGEQQARIRELRAQLEQFQNTTLPQQPGQQPPQQQIVGQAPPDRASIDREIEQRAMVLAQQQEFNRRCNEVADAGKRQYGDFDAKVGKLVGLVDGNDPQAVARYNSFLSAALETGEASKLIYSLGGDLDEASRILGLNPIQMAVELTKMSTRPMTEVSGMPRPLNPVASMGVNNRVAVGPDDPNSDNLTTEEWMRRRNEQITARRNAR